MSQKKQLVHAILNFLSNETEADADSLTVASQVISDAYSVDASDSFLALPAQYTLLDVFNAGLTSLNIHQQQPKEQPKAQQQAPAQDDLENNPKYQAFIKQLNDMGYFNHCDEETKKQRMEKAKEKFLSRSQTAPAATSASSSSSTPSAQSTTIDKVAAEKFKNEGNDHLKQKQFKLAVESYKKAIQADPTNAIYPANMAAAFLQMGDFDNAEKCCKKAIEVDPKYGKARSRLALIYQRKGKLNEAIEQLEQALQHDPNNEEYRSKLDELVSASAPSTAAAAQNPFASMMGGMGGMGGAGGNPLAGLANMMGGMGGMGGGGMPDFGSLLSNPEFMRTAMDLMQRPEMQSMVQNMMGGFMPGGMGGDEGGDENPLGLDDAALEKVLADPEVQNNPRLKQIFEECRERGLNHSLQYLSDPEVVGFMTRFVQRKMGGGQMEDDN